MRIDKGNNIIYFDNDEEFYDFCVSPDLVVKTSAKGTLYYDMDFTEWYKTHVDEATKMVILDDKSTILRRGGVVSYRTSSKKINAYPVNPIEPENPELLMEVRKKWIREIQDMNDDGLEETERSSKMNQVKTVENMMNKDEYKKCIEGLKNSTMFHMSLGSKELFHSNFLHWISLVNWSVFLEIMHKLADTTEFWWERENDNDGKPYHPDNKNIKVLREHRKFDLSIYLLDSEKEVKEVLEEDNDPTMEITHDNNGKRKVQKWIPVLVLENKMKSLPYKAQLEEYTQKAFEEWRKGEKLIKLEIKKLKQDSNDKEEYVIPSEWITNHGITFILLSLMDTNIGSVKIKQCLKYKKNQRSIIFKFAWKHATYSNLVVFLSEIVNTQFPDGALNQLVLNDYNSFLKALCALAETWKIIPEKSYRNQIAPWKINNDTAISLRQEIEQYKELRIHDIHEKIMYDQLLNLLERKLKDKSEIFERYNVKTNQINYNKGVKIFTNSNYLHGVGIVEVFFVVNKNFKLLIQVQGDRYCHMVLCDKIVKKDTSKKICVNTDALSGVLSPESIDTLSKYISIGSSKPTFPWKKPSWGQYGENHIYQYVLIPERATIEDVVKAMIEDLQNIKKWFNDLNRI